MAPPPAAAAKSDHELTDEEKLHQMGYAQELSRRFSRFNNFAISFTIISILSGCLTLYYFGLQHGGPPVMLWGWLLVGGIVILVGLSMAEICSSFPTAGGLYYWAAKLAPGNSAPIWSWFTGWFNLLGQVAVTAGISFGCAYSVSAFMALYTNHSSWLSTNHTMAILAVILFVQGLLNTFSIRLVALINDISVWWHIVGVLAILVILLVAPSSHTHQSASFLFGSEGWHAFTGLSGFSIPFYIFLVGLLNAQYTFTGYDASAHVTEETVQANIAGPKGIVDSIWVSLIVGFILLFAVSIAIPTHYPVTIGGHRLQGTRTSPSPACRGRSSSSTTRAASSAELLILVVIVAQFYCGMASVTANSRMIYAFSRDGAVPVLELLAPRQQEAPRARAHRLVRCGRSLHPGRCRTASTQPPTRAVTSIAVIGLYIAYLIPVFLRRINGKAFQPGPWVLSKTWGPIINWVAIVWVVFICIIFLLPTYSPDHAADLQLHADRRRRGRRRSPASGAPSRPVNGSRGRRSRARPRNSPLSSANWSSRISDERVSIDLR